jgi:hypothetical protein
MRRSAARIDVDCALQELYGFAGRFALEQRHGEVGRNDRVARVVCKGRAKDALGLSEFTAGAEIERALNERGSRSAFIEG